MRELASKYNHSEIEQPSRYKKWVESGYFTAGDKSKDPFCIVIPPPNDIWDMHGIQLYKILFLDIRECKDMICCGFLVWIMPVSQLKQKLMQDYVKRELIRVH